MLRDDVAEQRPTEWIGFALQRAKRIVTAVRVLRRIDDESSLGQFGAEGLVGAIAFRFRAGDRVHGRSLKSMLANHHGPLFIWLASR